MVPKHFSQAYPGMLHLKKKRRMRDGHLTIIWTAGKRQTIHPPDRYGVKIWKVNTLLWSKGHMWGIVTVLEEHTSGTPLYTPSSWYTPGKFWYTLGCTIHPVDKHWHRLSHKRVFAQIGAEAYCPDLQSVPRILIQVVCFVFWKGYDNRMRFGKRSVTFPWN